MLNGDLALALAPVREGKGREVKEEDHAEMVRGKRRKKGN